MAQWLLRIEGVNMGASVTDTQDLATLRGGSLALLDAPRRAGKVLDGLRAQGAVETWSLVTCGASQGMYLLSCGDPGAVERAVADALSGLAAPGVEAEEVYRHLTIMVDMVEIDPAGGIGAAMVRAEAANRLRQMTSPTMRFPGAGAAPCPVDRVRPAKIEISHPKHKRVSASVAARRAYGGTRDRDGRRLGFYVNDLGFAPADVPIICDDFAELIETGLDLRESLEGKIAVVHMDGNKFGNLRTRLLETSGVSPDKALAHFGTHLQELRRQMMVELHSLIRRKIADDGGKLKIETLEWGGDEARWVLPGWLALDFVGALFELSRGWTIPALGDCPALPLTHAVGLVVCNVKTPIRQATALSKELTDLAKEAGPVDSCQWEIIESVDIPDDLLSAHHRVVFGDIPRQALTLPAKDWDDAMAHMRALTGALPRSQLYRLLRLAAATGALRKADSGDPAVKDVKAELRHTLDHNGYQLNGNKMSEHHLLGPPMPGVAAGALVPLAVLAQLWDYLDPFRKGGGNGRS